MFVPTKYLPNPHDPLRAPDQRWRRCRYLVEHGRRPSSAREDDATRDGWRYLHAWWACRNRTDRERLAQRHPAVAAAHRLCSQAEPLQRAEVEARLLARQGDDVIASRCGLSPAAISAYHDLFFHVRDTLDAEIYIINIAVGPKVHSGFCEDDTDILLKLLGYFYGPLMVDLALRYYRNPPAMPPRLEGLDAAALTELYLMLQVQMLIRTLVTPAHAVAGRKLSPVLATPIAEESAASGPEASPDLSASASLREQVAASAPAVPPVVLPFDRSTLRNTPKWLEAGLSALCG